MFARLVMFKFGPSKRDAADRLASDLVPQIRDLDGCESVTAFGDDAYEPGTYDEHVYF